MKKLIGKGAFSKAYQVGENEVELHSTCPAKECYAMFSQGNPLAPVIEKTDDPYIFKMPLYPKVKAPKKQLNARAYEVFKILKSYEFYNKNYYEFTELVNKCESLTEEEKENICSLASDVCNAMDTHDMRFEISPRNISHDVEGNLIMLDCFFCKKHLTNTRSR